MSSSTQNHSQGHSTGCLLHCEGITCTDHMNVVNNLFYFAVILENDFFFYSCLHLFVIFSSEGLNNIFSGFQKDLKIKALFLGHLLFSCISVACGKNISC